MSEGNLKGDWLWAWALRVQNVLVVYARACASCGSVLAYLWLRALSQSCNHLPSSNSWNDSQGPTRARKAVKSATVLAAAWSKEKMPPRRAPQPSQQEPPAQRQRLTRMDEALAQAAARDAQLRQRGEQQRREEEEEEFAHELAGRPRLQGRAGVPRAPADSTVGEEQDEGEEEEAEEEELEEPRQDLLLQPHLGEAGLVERLVKQQVEQHLGTALASILTQALVSGQAGGRDRSDRAVGVCVCPCVRPSCQWLIHIGPLGARTGAWGRALVAWCGMAFPAQARRGLTGLSACASAPARAPPASGSCTLAHWVHAQAHGGVHWLLGVGRPSTWARGHGDGPHGQVLAEQFDRAVARRDSLLPAP